MNDAPAMKMSVSAAHSEPSRNSESAALASSPSSPASSVLARSCSASPPAMPLWLVMPSLVVPTFAASEVRRAGDAGAAHDIARAPAERANKKSMKSRVERRNKQSANFNSARGDTKLRNFVPSMRSDLAEDLPDDFSGLACVAISVKSNTKARMKHSIGKRETNTNTSRRKTRH